MLYHCAGRVDAVVVFWVSPLDMLCLMFFFEQQTAYEMRSSDWSSDVCSSDLTGHGVPRRGGGDRRGDGDTVAARLVGGLEARGAASPGCAGSGHSRIGPLSGGRSFVLYGPGRATFIDRERAAT